jgi:hypothetical protein
MEFDLRREILAEFVRISDDPVMLNGRATDSSRLIAAAIIVATRELQRHPPVEFEGEHGCR